MAALLAEDASRAAMWRELKTLVVERVVGRPDDLESRLVLADWITDHLWHSVENDARSALLRESVVRPSKVMVALTGYTYASVHIAFDEPIRAGELPWVPGGSERSPAYTWRPDDKAPGKWRLALASALLVSGLWAASLPDAVTAVAHDRLDYSRYVVFVDGRWTERPRE